MSGPEVQPPLPANIKWPQRTREWWAMWGASPQSAEFTANDWSELLDAALLHARFWAGDAKVASELRVRLAKFGSNPTDRARLRVAQANAKKPREAGGAGVRFDIASGDGDQGLPVVF
jgi:hypothetical protein